MTGVTSNRHLRISWVCVIADKKKKTCIVSMLKCLCLNGLIALHPLTQQTPNGVLDQVQFLPACCVCLALSYFLITLVIILSFSTWLRHYMHLNWRCTKAVCIYSCVLCMKDLGQFVLSLIWILQQSSGAMWMYCKYITLGLVCINLPMKPYIFEISFGFLIFF